MVSLGYEVGGGLCFPPRIVIKKDFSIKEIRMQIGRKTLNTRWP